MRSESRGFTLIELMIVVVTIGILAAIAIPNFMGVTNRAKEQMVKSNMHTIQVVMEDFYSRCGRYPTSLNDYADTAPSNYTGVEPYHPLSFTALLPGYQLPTNPFTGKPGSVDWISHMEMLLEEATPGTIMIRVDESGQWYEIHGYGAYSEPLSLILTNI